MEVNQNSLSPLLKPRFQKETITREQRAAPPRLLDIYKPAKRPDDGSAASCSYIACSSPKP